MVMTDSGGLQEEAPHLGRPKILVLRDVHRKTEVVEAGTVKLVERTRIKYMKRQQSFEKC